MHHLSILAKLSPILPSILLLFLLCLCLIFFTSVPFTLLHWSKKENDSKSFEAKDKWINIINRGRLVDVNDNCFLFFRAVEYCVRDLFNTSYLKHYNGENLKTVLMKAVLESTHE